MGTKFTYLHIRDRLADRATRAHARLHPTVRVKTAQAAILAISLGAVAGFSIFLLVTAILHTAPSLASSAPGSSTCSPSSSASSPPGGQPPTAPRSRSPSPGRSRPSASSSPGSCSPGSGSWPRPGSRPDRLVPCSGKPGGERSSGAGAPLPSLQFPQKRRLVRCNPRTPPTPLTPTPPPSATPAPPSAPPPTPSGLPRRRG
jgi:hypothetical protein